MKTIWATWRKNYIQRAYDSTSECLFCKIASEKCDKENFVLYRGFHNYVIMNLFPYTSGHLLIVPYRHTCDYRDLEESERCEMSLLEQKSITWIDEAFHPGGFNIGMNIGSVAGAGIDSHIHRHIVPRWKGDSNFMPVVGEARVMSISIEDAYDALLKIINQEAS
ncbi:MAG: HIT domain-containing protein [Caldisericia bacterium]|nr:HIT domain-containing protein [Caldisericia bacterium]